MRLQFKELAGIRAGLPASEILIPAGKPFGPGKALDITEASISIGGLDESQKFDESNKSVIFTISLTSGKTRLYT